MSRVRSLSPFDIRQQSERVHARLRILYNIRTDIRVWDPVGSLRSDCKYRTYCAIFSTKYFIWDLYLIRNGT